jgi:copper chaperone CopZ
MKRGALRRVPLIGVGIAALVAAVVGVSCCWLPLLLAVVGAGGVTIAGLSAWKPVLLPLSGLLLGIAWWAHLRQVRQRKLGCACATEETGKQAIERLRTVALLGVSVVTLGVWAAPYVFGVQAGAQGSSRATQKAERCWRLEIQGMTCGGCALHVQQALLKAGALRARVSYSEGMAAVCTPDTLTENALKQAVIQAGYGVGKIWQVHKSNEQEPSSKAAPTSQPKEAP